MRAGSDQPRARVKRGRIGKSARDHRRRVADQRLAILPREGRRRGEDEGVEAERRRPLQRRDMGIGRILDGEAAIEELVGLAILAGKVAMGVVLLGKEAAGAQDEDGEAMLVVNAPAEALRLELGRAVDVARRERPNFSSSQKARAAPPACRRGPARRSSARWSR